MGDDLDLRCVVSVHLIPQPVLQTHQTFASIACDFFPQGSPQALLCYQITMNSGQVHILPFVIADVIGALTST